MQEIIKKFKNNTSHKIVTTDLKVIQRIIENIENKNKIKYDLEKAGKIVQNNSKKIGIRKMGFKKYNFDDPYKEIKKYKNKLSLPGKKEQILYFYVGCLVIGMKMKLKEEFLGKESQKSGRIFSRIM